MSAASPDHSVRLGVVGLGRRGLFHLERWLGHADVRIVAACDRDETALRTATHLCDRRTTDPRDLLGDPAIDAILLTVPISERASLAHDILSAGKHLLVDPPVAAGVAEVRSLFRTAEDAGRRILVWSVDREEPDFRAASAVLGSGLVGSPRVIRFERWEAMIPAVHASADPLSRPIVGLLDQLVALADRPATTVFASRVGDAGASITVTFADGLRGIVSLHSSASVRLDHGWAIDAERGGYAAGRRWVRTTEGELYEVPADPLPVPTLEETLAAVVAGSAPSSCATDSLRFAALIAAVARSLMTGRTEPVETTA